MHARKNIESTLHLRGGFAYVYALSLSLSLFPSLQRTLVHAHTRRLRHESEFLIYARSHCPSREFRSAARVVIFTAPRALGKLYIRPKIYVIITRE